MSAVIPITEKYFEKEVIHSEKITLVYFWAEWCGPCKVMGPAVEKFARESPTVKVVKIDADQSHNIVHQYQIMAIPNVLVFKDGKVVNQGVGAMSVQKLKELSNV